MYLPNATIAVIPGPDTGNPYLQLLCGALRRRGAKWIALRSIAEGLEFGADLPANIIHVHWPENLWGAKPSLRLWPVSARHLAGVAKRTVARVRRMRALTRWLGLQRRLGKEIWWTMHNLRPHDGGDRVDGCGFRRMHLLTDLHIFHSEHALREYTSIFGTPMAHVIMPHGNYDGVFPQAHTPEDTRCRFGLPSDVPLFALTGGMRAYKGAFIAIETFKKLQGTAACVIAGASRSQSTSARLCELARDLSNVSIVDRELDDQEYIDVLHACDGVLLPYQAITTSGSLLAALTAGRGVVASRLPYFVEVLAPERDAAVLADGEDSDSFARAIKEYISIAGRIRGAAARRLADRFGWDRVVEPLAARAGCSVKRLELVSRT